jgi:DtxR family Mn-dependent transcriptional regulator
MNNNNKAKEEHLERLWNMKEDGQNSMASLIKVMTEDFDLDIIEEFAMENLIELDQEKDQIALTEQGEKRAGRVIRAHRIGERLLYHVFGGEFESGACEFEHTVVTELVDAICTLLGHPRECPHGMPIPEGECCLSSAKTTHNMVISLTELEVGKSARVAYINCKDDRQMHKLDGLQIRPGANVKMHQKYPCFVIDCVGANIALDEEIVTNISVWSDNGKSQHGEAEPLELDRKQRGWWRNGISFMGKTKSPPCCDIKSRSVK